MHPWQPACLPMRLCGRECSKNTEKKRWIIQRWTTIKYLRLDGLARMRQRSFCCRSIPVTWRRLFSDSLVTCRDSGYRHPIIKPADEVSCTRRRSPVGSSFPCQLIHLYPRTTDHCQWENDLCRHRRGAQLESDYLVHRSVRCPVSHWICLEQAEMAFITT